MGRRRICEYFNTADREICSNKSDFDIPLLFKVWAMMSFCSKIKNELAAIKPNVCCRESLCYGLLLFSRYFSVKKMGMQTENERTAVLYRELIGSVYGAEVEIKVGGRKRTTYRAEVVSEADRLRILASVDFGIYEGYINREEFSRECCSASFIRGAFLACGYLADPNISYRVDFPVRSRNLAEELKAFLAEHFTDANISTRGNGFVVYIKKSEMIVNLLAVMGASARSMEMIETTMIKDVLNHTNRARNCDSKNISRTVDASIRQRKAIEYLVLTDRLESLPEELVKAAKLRLENPNASLKELCRVSDEPITVSGLNHRLQRIMEIYKDSIKKK